MDSVAMRAEESPTPNVQRPRPQLTSTYDRASPRLQATNGVSAGKRARCLAHRSAYRLALLGRFASRLSLIGPSGVSLRKVCSRQSKMLRCQYQYQLVQGDES
jgi:hypothetical protein